MLNKKKKIKSKLPLIRGKFYFLQIVKDNVTFLFKNFSRNSGRILIAFIRVSNFFFFNLSFISGNNLKKKVKMLH